MTTTAEPLAEPIAAEPLAEPVAAEPEHAVEEDVVEVIDEPAKSNPKTSSKPKPKSKPKSSTKPKPKPKKKKGDASANPDAFWGG